MAGIDLSANEAGATGGQSPTIGYEFRSRWKIGSLPLLHVVRGIDPATGSRPPAIGVVAVGQVAIGVIGVGQLAVGLLAAGQVAIGALGAVGQVAAGARPWGLIQDHGPWAALACMVG